MDLPNLRGWCWSALVLLVRRPARSFFMCQKQEDPLPDRFTFCDTMPFTIGLQLLFGLAVETDAVSDFFRVFRFWTSGAWTQVIASFLPHIKCIIARRKVKGENEKFPLRRNRRRTKRPPYRKRNLYRGHG